MLPPHVTGTQGLGSHRHRPSKATIASDCLTCPPKCNFCVISQHDYMVVLAAGAWGLVFKPVLASCCLSPCLLYVHWHCSMSRCGGPTAEHRGAVPEVRSLISWQVARGHLQQDVDVTGVCGLSPGEQLHLGMGLLGLRILREAISDGVGASEKCQSWEGSLVCARGWHWVSMGLWLGFFFGAPTLVSVPPWGGGSVLSTHSPWATAAARCCLCSCFQPCPSAPNLRLLLCLVCVRGAGGFVRDTGGWLGRAEGVPWAKEQSLRACAVCVWDLQVLSCAGGLSRGVLPESATLWRCCV